MTADYDRALLARRAEDMQDAIADVFKHELDSIMHHKLAELRDDCAWAVRTFGKEK